MSRIFFIKSAKETIKRLPKHYIEQYNSLKKPLVDQTHYENPPGKYFRHSDGKIHHTSEVYQPPDYMRPPELNRCIVGNVGIISGRRQKKDSYPKDAIFITPKLQQHLFYSDILKIWLRIIVTKQVLKDVEALRSFDAYILESNEGAMSACLVTNLKRRMLFKLLDMKDENKPENSRILAKYERYIISREEAAWTNLSLEDAIDKLVVEEALEASKHKPLKEKFTKEFLKSLNREKLIQS